MDPSPRPPMLCIDRCCCTGLYFEDLKEVAKDGVVDLKRLQEETGCGMSCGLCVPYLRAMLDTGQTVFHELMVEGRAASGRGRRARVDRHSRQTA